MLVVVVVEVVFVVVVVAAVVVVDPVNPAGRARKRWWLKLLQPICGLSATRLCSSHLGSGRSASDQCWKIED